MGLQTLEGKMEQHVRRSGPSATQHSPRAGAREIQPPPSGAELSIAAKSMRVDMSRFSGANPYAWVSRVQRYFDYYHTPNNQRLMVASFHLDGATLDWFDWTTKNELIHGWSDFLPALTKRFGPSEYEDHFGKLSKLTQLGSLTEYQHQFEKLANNIVGVPEHVLISCFVSGLRHDIRKETQVYLPQSLIQAMGLAKLYADKFVDTFVYSTAGGRRHRVLCTALSQLLLHFPHYFRILRGQNGLSLYANSLLQKCLPEEKRGCYNCDEKFFMGHKCQGKFFLLISDEGEDVADIHIEGVSTLPQPTEITTEAPEISLHAMAGLLSPRTLRLNAIILGLQVQTLIDGGSTHNFIQERIAKFLKLPILTSPHFSVMIGNGESMVCKGYCPEKVIQLGIETFVVDFYVISRSLQGAEVVLGVH